MNHVSLLETCRLIREDLRAHRAFFKRNPVWAGGVSSVFCPGWISVFIYRLSRYFHHAPGLRIVARLLCLANHILTKSEISPTSDFGGGFVVVHPGGVVISSAKGGRDCVFMGGGLGGSGAKKDVGGGPGQPLIGDRVLFARHTFAQGPYRIGDDVVIGPKTYVHKDVEAKEFVTAQPDDLTARHVLKGKRDGRLLDEHFYVLPYVHMKEKENER
jgi:serine acetyltransferase